MESTIDGYPASEPTLRSGAELVRAHDILASVLLGEVRVELTEHARTSARAALDVLCFVVHHNHNPTFERNLAAIEAAAEAAGYELRRKEPAP